jgi:hypothetical protein
VTVPEFTTLQASLLWGLNAGLLALWWRSHPSLHTGIVLRIGTVLSGGTLIAAGFLGSGYLETLDRPILAHIVVAASGFTAFWAASLFMARAPKLP